MTGIRQRLAAVWQRRESRWLLLIVLAGAAVRVAGALYMGDRMAPVSGAYDQIFYHDLGLNLLAGKNFAFTRPPWPFIAPGAPSAYYSFAYPLFLAGVYAVAGPHALAARVVQALICSLLPLQVYWLVRKIADGGWRMADGGPRVAGGSWEAVALVAAGITAFYAYFILYSAALQTEGLYLVLVAWSLLATLDLAERPTWKGWLSWALAVTLASLLRQVFMPVAAMFFVYVLFRARGRVKPAHVALAGGVAIALIVPWTVRNYLTYDRFLLLNSQYGQVLWNANHPGLGVHFVGDAMFPVPEDLRGANEVDLTNELMRRGVQLIAAEPWRFVRLSLSRAGVLFLFWPSRFSPPVSNVSRTLSFGICLPFMVAGLVLSAREWRRWLLLYLFIGAYALIHIVSWAQIRYRMPIDLALIPFAALAAVALVGWVRRRRQEAPSRDR
jgi:hypothetical protein